MNVNAYVATRFPLIEPILLNILFTAPCLIYSSILIQQYVILLRTLLVKPTPPLDSTHFVTAAHTYVVMSPQRLGVRGQGSGVRG